MWAMIRSGIGMGAQPCFFSQTKSNFAAGEWQSRQGFFSLVSSTLSPRSWISVPFLVTFNAKNSQPLVFGKGCPIVLHHRLSGGQLQNCAGRIFLVGHAVAEDPDCLFELIGIGVLYPRVSDFRHVEHAPEGFRGYNNVVS